MKKIINLLFFCFIGLAGFAQEQEPAEQLPPDAKTQERIKNLRIAYISDKLGLTPDQAEKFWPIYREFAEEESHTAGVDRCA
jgi:hypothetical protein